MSSNGRLLQTWLAFACLSAAERYQRLSQQLAVDAIFDSQGRPHRQSQHSKAIAPVFLADDERHNAEQEHPDCEAEQQSVEEFYRHIGIQIQEEVCSSPGIKCRGFFVVEIQLRGRRDINATIDSFPNLKKLRSLDVSETSLSGEIVAFAALAHLEILDLSDTRFKGDISELKSLAGLQHFYAKNTQVRGDIQDLQVLTNLTKLDLQHTEVKGDSFPNLKKLRSLDVSSTSLSGNIVAFASLAHLEILDLSDTRFKGDISELRSLAGLQHFHAKNTQVRGDVQDFQVLTNLTKLNLQHTQVTGDVRDLARLTNLRTLHLRETAARGDIGSFENMRELESLDLHGLEQVVGNVSVFRFMPELKVLRLDATSVVGDICAFKTARKLERLGLDVTRVHGDVAAFEASSPSLIELYLSHTQVSGSIQVFAHFPSLEGLGLASTAVFGSIDVFASATKLIYLGLARSKFFGDIAALERMENLHQVSMSHTNVSGDISVLHSKEKLWYVGFESTSVFGDIQIFTSTSKMKFINLAYTTVSGDISVFAATPMLKTLRLSSARGDSFAIRGDIQVFQNRTPLLEDMRLAQTSVYGNLEHLHLEQLQTLDIFSTAVKGDIGSLFVSDMLSHIYLGSTDIGGNVDAILSWKAAEVIDLSDTNVDGKLTERWRGRCSLLRTMKLSRSKISWLPTGPDRWTTPDMALLPALKVLEISGCPLDGPAEDLVLPLAACSLASLIAVQSGLVGRVPSLRPMPPVKLNGNFNFDFTPPLALSLEILDLSNNNIEELQVPRSSHILKVRENQGRLKFGSNVLHDIVKDSNRWADFRWTTFETSEFETLLREGKLGRTEAMSFHDRNASFRCYNLKAGSLQITPSQIMPEWCQCMPGWFGKATNCTRCPVGKFSKGHDEPTCSTCPLNSTTLAAGATSGKDCKCDGGVDMVYLHRKPTCGCPPGYANFDDRCENCSERHLHCPQRNTQLVSATPEEGFARIAPRFSTRVFRCLAPATQRCRRETASEMGCATGYRGPLCMDCMEGFYASGKLCKVCRRDAIPSWMTAVAAVIMAGGCFGMASAFATRDAAVLRRQLEQVKLRMRQLCFAPGYLGSLQVTLMQTEVPMLLQLTQLWGVMALLFRASGPGEDGSSWEIPYIQSLQLAMSNLANIASLQCSFGGSQTRWLLALASPVFPLVLFLGCFGLERQQHGLGINTSLKVLTMLFIGGAYKCSALKMCQRVDAYGEKLQEFAFLKNLPHVSCEDGGAEANITRALFWPCLFGYAVLIPSFLAYLYAKQHHALRHERMPVQSCIKDDSTAAVAFKDLVLARRLVATVVANASSYVSEVRLSEPSLEVCSVHLRVLLSDQSAALTFQASHGESRGLPNVSLGSEDVPFAITEMLMEYCILEEKASDRFLVGMKAMLQKYSLCRNVWMEIVLKVVSVVLVQVVSNTEAMPTSLTSSGLRCLVLFSSCVQHEARCTCGPLRSFGSMFQSGEIEA
ncbi:XIAO [Symbiodinium sp. CCMP2592]|nr:XIAO [Symbiodinium sp. CCMP2592]